MGISEIWWILLIMAVGSYLIGSINFSIIISRRKGRDIRSVGSGNPGMMNMSRNFGLKTGVAILLLDMLKGGVPTFIGWVVFRGDLLEGTTFVISDMTKYMCGFFAVLGHIFPVYLKFRGGKGIATTIGIFVVANPLVGVISGLCGLAFILITSMGSMGSLIAVTPPAIAAEIIFYGRYIYVRGSGFVPAQNGAMLFMLLASVVFVIGICVLTWVAHRMNIKRLLTGEEHQTSWSAMIRKYKDRKKSERAKKKKTEAPSSRENSESTDETQSP
ncbi:MAG: glycerol-3-phosphate acyltransferase [Clostridia bacterium]|nr:glycerol-3-phosphate acyltransferase [Clostridia bacterium]